MKGILELSRPDTIRQMRKFLGMVGLNHKITPEIRTLIEMTRKGTEMQWGEKQIKAFEYLCDTLQEDERSTPPNTPSRKNSEIEICTSRDEENQPIPEEKISTPENGTGHGSTVARRPCL